MHGSQMIYAIAFILLQGCSPTLTALFTPARPVEGRYEVCVTAEPIEALVSRPDDLRYTVVEQVDALDAFGTAGSYDRAKVAQLYGGSKPKVARGWQQQGDRFESVTLVSPYPDATLLHLEPGTLVIRFIIEIHP